MPNIGSPGGSTGSSPMTKQHIEVITSVERRRHWSREEKERLVAAALEPGTVVSDVARSAGIHVSQLFRWRKELCQMSAPSVPPFIPIEVVAALPAPDPLETTPAPRARKKPSIVTIELGRGRRIRVESDVDTEALGRILDVVERR
ncbi:transposase [Sinorhizobium fredii]|uniref:Transposase n=5 Tax=Rhizobium fredii TaxID=380 RepID=A0A844AGP4_RHIFR|nr:transposase [Sinorhizobium fredii]MQW93981.1 transposase [Sinorhizobium fredii]MQW97573.1 transposase [Sinorhizobium fredii]MQW99110.1 transposase [Sinorhizobium fredii]MQW99142.1 transposase [Sinorhizobium fredii]